MRGKHRKKRRSVQPAEPPPDPRDEGCQGLNRGTGRPCDCPACNDGKAVEDVPVGDYL